MSVVDNYIISNTICYRRELLKDRFTLRNVVAKMLVIHNYDLSAIIISSMVPYGGELLKDRFT